MSIDRVDYRALTAEVGHVLRALPHVVDLRATPRTSLQGLVRRVAGGEVDAVDLRPDGEGWRVQAELVTDGHGSAIEIARLAQQAIRAQVGDVLAGALTIEVCIAQVGEPAVA